MSSLISSEDTLFVWAAVIIITKWPAQLLWSKNGNGQLRSTAALFALLAVSYLQTFALSQ